jgi:hypothetical protein
MAQTNTGDSKSMYNLYFHKTNPIEVAHSLKGLEYPVDKNGLLKCARQNEARAEVIRVIKELPEKEYTNPLAISEEIGNIEHYGAVS